MILTLAVRHLFVRRARALVLLSGFALGVGVMIVLLSVGEAMLEQSRDVSLVGGGEVTVLPLGIDIEAMRTGGVSGMFFGIDRARFVSRQLLGGPRQAGVVAALSPLIEDKLMYLGHGDRVVAVRAGATVPSRAAAVGAALDVREGRWIDSPEDSAWIVPAAQQLYDELDHFHVPPRADSTWGEWHYFNLLVVPEEWWYLTFLVGGEVPSGRWGGQLLVTRRRADGRYQRYSARVPSVDVHLDTLRADLALGGNTVTQRDGQYRLRGKATGPDGQVSFDLRVEPDPARYFPPVELRRSDFLSGYVVPALRADASGTVCVDGNCREVNRVPAYHDHNWGVWRDVTWEWGMGRGKTLDLLYGGVRAPGDSMRGGNPFFLAVVDSLGVLQVLRFQAIRYEGALRAGGAPVDAPARFTLEAGREGDTVRVAVDVVSAQATVQDAGGLERVFLQMRGHFTLEGRVGGVAVADEGQGFFETYVDASRPPLP